MRDLNEQKDILQLQIDKLDYNLSNLEKSIPTIVATASKLSTLWHDSDYETKQRIEKLVYPDGIFWDKQIRNYRTEKRNRNSRLNGQVFNELRKRKSDLSTRRSRLVRAKGIEPIRLSAPDPKSGLSTNFNTPADFENANVRYFSEIANIISLRRE